MLPLFVLLVVPARAMLLFLSCGVVPLLLTFDTSACDAVVRDQCGVVPLVRQQLRSGWKARRGAQDESGVQE